MDLELFVELKSDERVRLFPAPSPRSRTRLQNITGDQLSWESVVIDFLTRQQYPITFDYHQKRCRILNPETVSIVGGKVVMKPSTVLSGFD